MPLLLLTKEILIKNQIQTLKVAINFDKKNSMKWFRTLYFLLPILLLSSNLKGQHAVGVIGGVNLPFVNFTDFVIDSRYNNALMITSYGGITYRYQAHKNVGLQIDLAYSEKGWAQTIQDTLNTITNTISYIELPVYLRCSLLGDRKFNIIINAGCFAAYAIDQNTQFETEDGRDLAVAEYNILTDNRGDFGVLIGLGISYNFKFGYLQLEGGYKGGFSNILPVNEITKENPIVSTNQTPTFLLSYLIPINRGSKTERK